MNANDKRSYIFELKRIKEETTEDIFRYCKDQQLDLGSIRIVWINAFGEKNIYYTKSIMAKYDPNERFFIKILNPPEKLYVEEPQIISIKISNVSAESLNLQLHVNESETKTIKINSISKAVSMINIV